MFEVSHRTGLEDGYRVRAHENLAGGAAFALAGGSLDGGALAIGLTNELRPGGESGDKGESKEESMVTSIHRDFEGGRQRVLAPICRGEVPDLDFIDLGAVEDPANNMVCCQDDLTTGLV